MQFIRQVWTLTKKDLLIVGRRRWISTLLRALILPIIITFILGYVRVIRATDGFYGVQEPFTLMPLGEAFGADSRSKFVIVDHNLRGNDVRAVIDGLSSIARGAGKDIHVISNADALDTLCEASSRGVTDCFAAVEFWSSPDEESNGIWNYTLHYDSIIGSSFDAKSQRNSVQVVALPLQHAIGSMIADAHGGPSLPDNVQQYGFSPYDESQKEKYDRLSYDSFAQFWLAWAFFIPLCGGTDLNSKLIVVIVMAGITYHLTGYVTNQREKGLLQLIDAMLPNKNRWQCVAIRVLSTHLAFDLIYAPGWIAMGVITGAFTFPNIGAGWYVLLYLLCGLALSSYSILAASLFRREQLAAMSALIAAIVFSLATQFGESLGNYTTTTPGVWALSALFAPASIVYFVILTAATQDTFSISGDQRYLDPYFDTFGLTGGALLGLLVLQIVLYPIVGSLLERYLHGRSSRARHLRTQHEMGSHSVRLSGFTKRYNVAAKKRDRVRAVDDLSFNLHAGSITVLLGTNGSGKSTTLNAIAGLETITSGQIEMDGTGGIGLCPQKNVHWSDMTVEEHVRFFEQVKRPSSSSSQTRIEVERIVTGCDLDIKKHAQAKTLSGGQMRKLQLAMMLSGGSKVCCIDEASSGIDSLARRKVWDILLQERGARTMLLTTHFLDETEVLSDHVVVLSKGKLKAEGSVASLKNQFGRGYHVILPGHESLDRFGSLPRGINYVQEYNTLALEAPNTSSLTNLVSALDRSGVAGYRIRGPTIEDVFLKLAEEMKDTGFDAAGLITSNVTDDSNVSSLGSRDLGLSTMKLNTGKGCGPLKQTGVLFLKRLTVLKHNFMPYQIAGLFVPLVLAGMVTRFFIGKDYPNGLPCVDPSGGSVPDFGSTINLAQLSYDGVFGPSSSTPQSTLRQFIPNEEGLYGYYGYAPGKPRWRQTKFVDTFDEFQAQIQESVHGSYSAYTWGGFYIGDPVVFAFQGTDSQDALWAQAGLQMLLSNTTIELNVSQFYAKFEPNDILQGVVAVITVLGCTVYSGLFALYPTAERLRNVRAMQYSNGILSSSLWVAYALFDFMFIILISTLATIIWYTQYAGWYGLGYVFVVILLYSIAATVYSYLISLCVKSQLAAMACTSLVQTVIVMLVFTGYAVTVNSAPATQLYTWFNYIYFTTALICPAVSLFRALLVTLNVYSLVCRGPVKAAYPGEITLYGGPILYLTLQTIMFVTLLAYWEAGSLEVFGIRRRNTKATSTAITLAQNQDVVEDEKHLAQSREGLSLANLNKTFGSNRAVENVSLGVLPSEKLALLGPNGAGKSTTISLIRGELRPDSTHPPAEVFISGDSLMRAPVAAKNHLGVCPQFDAVDSMTLSEHLHFYARARGVPDKDANIQQLVTMLGLTEHTNKLVKKLSGGTKRKLSLAIALIANPSVLLLDEPSSGMDPAAKRALWQTLTNISAGRCLLLTTHSMEEAAALCDRAAIMARKMLALGAISDLCAQHGDKIYIHIVHQNAPYTSAPDMAKLWRWIRATFVVADTEERSFGGQVRFAVPTARSSDGRGLADGHDMGRLFRIVEAMKEEMGIRDYSIGPATLDQVFLNVVSKHNVVEENTQPHVKDRWIVSRLLRRSARK